MMNFQMISVDDKSYALIKPPGLASGLQAAGKIKLSIRHAEHARKRLTEALQNH
jgi:hypothetical protein